MQDATEGKTKKDDSSPKNDNAVIIYLFTHLTMELTAQLIKKKKLSYDYGCCD